MAAKDYSGGKFFGEYKYLIFLAAFTFISLLFLQPGSHFTHDLQCWQAWCKLIHEQGLRAVYDPELSTVDYMPLYVYVLKIYTLLAGEKYLDQFTIHYLKAVPLFFEILSIAILAARIENKERRLFCFIIGALNIGFLYNSQFWQQVDGILAFFLLISFLFAIKNKAAWSLAFFVLAFNFKIQAVILLPLLGLLWLQGIKMKDIIRYAVIAFTIQLVIILPFLYYGNAKNISGIVFNSYNHYENISLNAYNFWYLVLDSYPPWESDKSKWMGISYHQSGLLLYVLSIVVILVPLLYSLIKNRIRIPSGDHTKYYILSAALLIYVFFYFNTQMHERYIHCSMVFLTFLAFRYRHWLIYFLVTLNYFLSLEGILSVNRFIGNLSFLFNTKTQAVVYGAGLAWLFILWFRERRTFAKEGQLQIHLPT